MMKVYCHPRCTTCKKALTYLDNKNVKYELIDITQTPPPRKDIEAAFEKYQKWGRVFNTSGMKYREQKISDKVKTLSPDKLFDILEKDGMIVKRPFVVLSDNVLTGFKEEEWSKAI